MVTNVKRVCQACLCLSLLVLIAAAGCNLLPSKAITLPSGAAVAPASTAAAPATLPANTPASITATATVDPNNPNPRTMQVLLTAQQVQDVATQAATIVAATQPGTPWGSMAGVALAVLGIAKGLNLSLQKVYGKKDDPASTPQATSP